MLHPNHLPTSLLFIITCLITLFHIPTSFSQSQENQRYVDCNRNFECGNIDVGYPFSGGNRPDYCGYPGFNLTCRDTDTLLTFEPLNYQVISMDVATQSLRVFRNDLVISNTCPVLVYNDTFDLNILRYSSDVRNLSLFYGCTSVIGISPANIFPCTTNGTDSDSFFATSPAPDFDTDLVSCNSNIVVRVSQGLNLGNFSLLSEGILGGFGLQWEANNTNCNNCNQSGGRCGYNLDSDSFACYCSDRPYDLTCNDSSPNDSRSGSSNSLQIILPVVAAVIVGVALGWLVFYCRQRWKIRIVNHLSIIAKKERPRNRIKPSKCSTSNIKGALKSLPGSPKEYDYKELRKATNNFDPKNKLGQGGFGAVYKGLLPNENLEIAVKCFLRENMKGQDDSLSELSIINRLRHRHLVRLLGWCHKNGKLLLVYEYMPNGSLDQHLFSRPDKAPLDWNLRYKIISGVASALHYLHNDFDERVVHRDLKASNIMLDSNFNAKLGDFGLARVLKNNKTSYMETEGVAGTIGYIAPECFHTGKATQQSDVYALGAVLLEVVCGLRPGTNISHFVSLVDWVWYLHRDRHVIKAVDPRLRECYVVEEAERLLILGLACSHPIANERPKAQAIVQMLSGTLPLPYVPPFKPAFVWPGTAVPVDIDSTTSDTTLLTSKYSHHYINMENNTM